jgi:hypothetical protein
MKKIISIILSVTLIMALSGCQFATKHLGGSMTVNLEPNVKLVNVTWKEDSLWFLTKPMTENDIAETYCFEEDSEFGIIEGTVTIVEHKK